MSDMSAPHLTNNVLAVMSFRHRLLAIRKDRGLTQQRLADLAGINVIQIRRYETDVSQPSIDAVRKLAKALHTTTDLLLFDEDERGPADDLRLQFEAVQRLDPHEQAAIKTLLEGVIAKHEVRRVVGS
jgi:transcriptional regulator with XRE-family HTH domain